MLTSENIGDTIALSQECLRNRHRPGGGVLNRRDKIERILEEVILRAASRDRYHKALKSVDDLEDAEDFAGDCISDDDIDLLLHSGLATLNELQLASLALHYNLIYTLGEVIAEEGPAFWEPIIERVNSRDSQQEWVALDPKRDAGTIGVRDAEAIEYSIALGQADRAAEGEAAEREWTFTLANDDPRIAYADDSNKPDKPLSITVTHLSGAQEIETDLAGGLLLGDNVRRQLRIAATLEECRTSAWLDDPSPRSQTCRWTDSSMPLDKAVIELHYSDPVRAIDLYITLHLE